jgi:hypothetical protein
MKLLSLGDISKLTGYSRASIHNYAVADRIPGDPVTRPPGKQFRYADTEKLRDWCSLRKEIRVSALPRKGASGSHSARVLRTYKKGMDILNGDDFDPDDLKLAGCILDAAAPLLFEFQDGPSPVARGVLAALSHHLLLNRAIKRDEEAAMKIIDAFYSVQQGIAHKLKHSEV